MLIVWSFPSSSSLPCCCTRSYTHTYTLTHKVNEANVHKGTSEEGSDCPRAVGFIYGSCCSSEMQFLNTVSYIPHCRLLLNLFFLKWHPVLGKSLPGDDGNKGKPPEQSTCLFFNGENGKFEFTAIHKNQIHLFDSSASHLILEIF